MRIFFVLTLLISCLSSNVWAAQGRDEAAAVCEKATMGQRLKDCLKVVQEADSFEVAALKLCSDLSFSAKVTECLKLISNRTYLATEVHRCEESGTDSRKLDCMKNSGKLSMTGVQAQAFNASNTNLLGQLKSVETKIKDGQDDAALLDLGKLIRELERNSGR